MGYRATVDKELCISSGKCVADLPDVFRFDEDELGDVVTPHPPADDARLVAVARNCPSCAISVVDDAGNPIAP